MDRAVGEAVLQGVVEPGILGVAAAGREAVVADEREGIGAARRVVQQHRVSAERALAAEGQRTEMGGGDAAEDFVIEGLAGPRAIAGVRIAAPGQAVVDRVGVRHVGEVAGLRV